jgi:hypothetical protein
MEASEQEALHTSEFLQWLGRLRESQRGGKAGILSTLNNLGPLLI